MAMSSADAARLLMFVTENKAIKVHGGDYFFPKKTWTSEWSTFRGSWKSRIFTWNFSKYIPTKPKLKLQSHATHIKTSTGSMQLFKLRRSRTLSGGGDKQKRGRYRSLLKTLQNPKVPPFDFYSKKWMDNFWSPRGGLINFGQNVDFGMALFSVTYISYQYR